MPLVRKSSRRSFGRLNGTLLTLRRARYRMAINSKKKLLDRQARSLSAYTKPLRRPLQHRNLALLTKSSSRYSVGTFRNACISSADARFPDDSRSGGIRQWLYRTKDHGSGAQEADQRSWR